VNVVPKKSWVEQRMMRRFFGDKYGLPEVGEYMANQKHKEVQLRPDPPCHARPFAGGFKSQF
jgi:hypothetical protein